MSSLARAVGHSEAQQLCADAKAVKPRAPPPGLEPKQKPNRFPKAPCRRF